MRLPAVLVVLVATACTSALPPETASPTSRAVAGDLVYTGGRVFAMPDARVVGAVDIGAVARDADVGFNAVNLREDPPTPPPQIDLGPWRWRTFIDAIDLRTGQRRLRIDAGVVELSGSEGRFGPLRPGMPGMPSVIPYADGRVILLARRLGATRSPTVRIERYDAHSGALLASREAEGATASLFLSGSFAPIDAEHMLVVHRGRQGGRRNADWLLLGPDLRELARSTRDEGAIDRADPRSLAWTPYCSPDVSLLPGQIPAWATVCELAFARVLLLAEPRTLREVALLPLPEPARLGRTIGWHAAGDTLILVTEKPALVRVSLGARRIVDERLVVPAPGLPFDENAAYVASYYEITRVGAVTFTPDGGVAYLRQFDARSRRFLVAIEVGQARVVATQFTGQDVRALAVSRDGARLYALVADARYADEAPSRLVLLDARTLRVLAQTPALDPGPRGITAVIPR